MRRVSSKQDATTEKGWRFQPGQPCAAPHGMPVGDVSFEYVRSIVLPLWSDNRGDRLDAWGAFVGG